VESPEEGLRALMALRRPAAAKAGGRPRVLRRPAASVGGEADLADKFAAGEWIEASSVPLTALVQDVAVVAKGEYWQANCQLCGTIRTLRIRGAGDIELALGGEGTDHEELLKWISGNPTEPVRVHLCGKDCKDKVEANGLIHAKELRLKKKDEGGWTDNLKESVDELAKLRREVGEENNPPGTGDGTEKREKKKKRKREKRKRSSSEKSLDKKRARDRRKKMQPQKDLSQVYGSTALDPDPRVRSRVLRRLRKKMKKKKSDSSSQSGSSSSGSSEGSDQESSHSEEVFPEKHKVRAIARRAPGALTLATVKEMQRQLLTTSGAVWETSKGSVQPVALQYYRSQLVNKLSGGAAREGLTLSWALDLALQGRVAELADCLAQRLKSVEMTASGSSWMVSQRVEVVPPEKGSLSTRAEAQEAAKETKEELKVKGMTKGREKGKNDSPGSNWRTGPKGEGKGKDKGKNKKGSEREERRKDS